MEAQICLIFCILQTQKISAMAAHIDNERLFVYDTRCRHSLDTDTVETSDPNGIQEQSPFIGSQGRSLLKRKAFSLFDVPRKPQNFRWSSHGVEPPLTPPPWIRHWVRQHHENSVWRVKWLDSVFGWSELSTTTRTVGYQDDFEQGSSYHLEQCLLTHRQPVKHVRENHLPGCIWAFQHP